MLYIEEYGYFMLRVRYFFFEIILLRVKVWLMCMYEVMDEINLEGFERDEFYYCFILIV